MAQKRVKKDKTSEYLSNCSGCDTEYSKTHPPVTLPCGHNLCKPCVTQLRRRNGMIRCPVDNLERKVQAVQINVDFLDFIELIRDEKIEIPRKRKSLTDRQTQCDSLLPEENYEKKLQYLKKKQRVLEEAAAKYTQQYSQALQLTYQTFNYVAWPYSYQHAK